MYSSLAFRRASVRFRLRSAAPLHRRIFQKAGNEDHSRKRHPPITTTSRSVIANQCRRYSGHVTFFIRIRNRFFTECMLITAGCDRRFDGTTLLT